MPMFMYTPKKYIKVVADEKKRIPAHMTANS